MLMRTKQQTGNAAMLGYAAFTAISSVLIHYTNQSIPALLSAFYTFSFCLMIYALLNLQILIKWRASRSSWISLCMLNVTTAICWIFTFLALQYLSAELYLFVYLCAMPISGSIIQNKHWLKTIGLIFGLIALIHSYHLPNLYWGSALAFLGGVSGTVYSIYSKKIADQFSTSEILASRFYATVLLTFCFCLALHQFKIMPAYSYLQFALLAFISVVIPLTLFQIGLKNLNLQKTLAFLPLAPLFCFLMNYAMGFETLHWQKALSVLFITIFMLI